jgi:hypothetical protein
LNFLFAAPLAALWGTLNGITVIAYLSMMNLTFPSNFNILNNILIDLATFDIVPEIDWINDKFFTTRYCEGPIEQPALGFSLNGFES